MSRLKIKILLVLISTILLRVYYNNFLAEASESIHCGASYTKNGSMVMVADENCTEFVLTGSYVAFQVFNPIPREIRSRLKSISLAWTRFEVSVLLESLEGCTNLEILHLTDVKWDGEFQRKVYLPKLRSFVLTPNFTTPTTSSAAINSSIFVYKQSVDWLQDMELWKTVDIFVQSPNGQIVKMMENEVALQSIEDSNIFSTLFELGPINSLQFHNTEIAPEHLQFLHKIKKLQYTVFRPSTPFRTSLSDILQNCDEAEEILIDFVKGEPESVDLKSIPVKNLRSIRLLGVSLRWSSTGLPVRFDKLEVFYLELCDFIPSLVRFTSVLRSFRLTHVNIFNENINDLFKFEKLSGLRELQIWNVNGDQVALDISLNPNIQYLILRKCEIFASSSIEMPNIITFHFENIKIPETIIQNFSITFRKLKQIIFPFKIDPFFLSEILLNTEVHHLFFFFDWDPKNKESQQYKNMVSYLTSLGVPEGSRDIITLKIPANGTKLVYYQNQVQMFHESKKSMLLALYQVFYPCICVLGIIGNIISALVLSRNEMLKFTSSYILLGLAIWDSLFLITSLTQLIWITQNLKSFQSQFDSVSEDILVEQISKFLLYPLNKSAYTGSVYLTLLITVDRFIAVTMPLRAKSILTSKYTLRNILLLSLFSLFLNLPRWFESISLKYPLEGKYWNFYHPLRLVKDEEYRRIYQLYCWSFFMFVIPFVLMMFLNVKIWLEIRRAVNSRRSMTGPRTGQQTSTAETSITKMLMSVVILFLICNSINAALVWDLITDKQRSVSSNRLVLIELVALQPLLINSSANFIIYCAMGTKFRAECRQMFRGIFSSFRVRLRSARREGTQSSDILMQNSSNIPRCTTGMTSL